MAGCWSWRTAPSWQRVPGSLESAGGSPLNWVLLTFVLHFVGFLILLALPSLRLTCPWCVAPYRRGAKACASCGSVLPDDVVADRLVRGARYDGQCPHCGTPYRTADYRPDAVKIVCPSCRSLLPAAAGGWPNQVEDSAHGP
jgi:hypothetical protein